MVYWQPYCDCTDSKEAFKRKVFYGIIDSVIAGLTAHYEAAKERNDHLSFLWS